MSGHSVRLVTYDRTFLNLSWHWLNDPEIKALTMTPDFSREDQDRFFASLEARDDYVIWGVAEPGGQPIGACGIKGIADGEGEIWTYLGERDWWGRGLGLEIIRQCETKARELGLHGLRMIVSRANARSIGAYRKAGFAMNAEQPDETVWHYSKAFGS